MLVETIQYVVFEPHRAVYKIFRPRWGSEFFKESLFLLMFRLYEAKKLTLPTGLVK